MKKLYHLAITVSVVILFSSCFTQKINKEYNLFQKGLDSLKAYDYKATVIQNNDLLNIQIASSTLSQEQASIFNIGSGSSGTSSNNTSSTSASTGGGVNYQVDYNGFITLPIIGKVKSEGLTTEQLTKVLKVKLDSIIKEPNIIVRFASIKINVLGEVKAPGTKTFTNVNPTIIDAIAQCGDFTDGANRKEVYLVREVNGVRTTFKLNMLDASVFNGDTYQLVQNDLIYVPANDTRLKAVNQTDIQQKLQIAQIVLQGISAIAVIVNTYLIIKRL